MAADESGRGPLEEFMEGSKAGPLDTNQPA
jgi:hypothetical protein